MSQNTHWKSNILCRQMNKNLIQEILIDGPAAFPDLINRLGDEYYELKEKM